MTEPTLSVDYMDLVRVVARQMGYGSTYSSGTVQAFNKGDSRANEIEIDGGVWPSWAGNAAINIGGTVYGISSRKDDDVLIADPIAADIAADTEYVLVQSITDDKADTFRDIQDVIDQAYQELCFPAPSDESYFIWSWLLERASISFEDNVANYDLPPNFGQFIDTAITYKAGLDLPSVTLLSQKEYRGEQSRDDSAGVPKYLMWRQKSFTATTGRRFEACLYPTPASEFFPDPEFSTGRLTSHDGTDATFGLGVEMSSSDSTFLANVATGVPLGITSGTLFLIDDEIIEVTSAPATTELNGAIDASVTSLNVDAITGFPDDPDTTSPFNVMIGTELLTVTDYDDTTPTTWTVTRGTPASGHSTDAAVTQVNASSQAQYTVTRGVKGTTPASHAASAELYKIESGDDIRLTGGTLPNAPAQLIVPGSAGTAESVRTITSADDSEQTFTVVNPSNPSDANAAKILLSGVTNFTIRHNVTTFSRDASLAFDGAHLEYLFRVVPDALNPTNKYPLCGSIHGDTLMKACQAVAERKLGDDAGIYEAKFKERLAASIAVDRAVKATMGI